MFSTIKKYIFIGGICIIAILFGALALYVSKYKIEKNARCLAETQLSVSQAEIQNLLAYNKKLQTQINNIEKDYIINMNNIPADICGDAKPSKELLEYFKSIQINK